jgi:hypothetical protein
VGRGQDGCRKARRSGNLQAGLRALHDGYDLISQEIPVVIENSWAMANGYINSGTGRPAAGNSNGFKVGSSKTGIRHVRQSVAFGNRANGFYANHSSGGNDWYNNTSYSNGTQYNLLASTWDAAGNRTDGVTLTGARAHRMRNNIGLPNRNSYVDGYGVDTAFNTWDLGITPAATDFVSVEDAGAMGPRKPDGSLPDVDFMKLRAGSQLIDRGIDVGLAYAGSAPDLGAYEFGVATAGTGGSAGARRQRTRRQHTRRQRRGRRGIGGRCERGREQTTAVRHPERAGVTVRRARGTAAVPPGVAASAPPMTRRDARAGSTVQGPSRRRAP